MTDLEMRIYDGCFCFYPYRSQEPYAIELSRIDTPEKALAWVAHLSEKNWMKPHDTRHMIWLLCKHFDWEFRTP